MVAKVRQKSQWGQRVTLAAPWALRNARVVLQADARDAANPPVCTANLSVSFGPLAFFGSCVMRWQISTGIGGQRVTYLLDTQGSQQISLPFETLTASILIEEAVIQDTAPFAAPTAEVFASVGIGDGMVASQRATYTQWVLLQASPGPNNFYQFAIPVGANSWRVMGVNPTAPGGFSPFVAGVTYQTGFGNPNANDSFTGDALIDLHQSGDFMPLPGGASLLAVENTTVNALVVGIQWGLDL